MLRNTVSRMQTQSLNTCQNQVKPVKSTVTAKYTQKKKCRNSLLILHLTCSRTLSLPATNARMNYIELCRDRSYEYRMTVAFLHQLQELSLSPACEAYFFNRRGPTLSPVSLLCFTWAPLQRGKVSDLQHLQYAVNGLESSLAWTVSTTLSESLRIDGLI